MARISTATILADELHRVLGEQRRIEGEIERLGTERKRLSTLVSRLLHLLRAHAGPRAFERVVRELGLATVESPAADKVPAPRPRAPVARPARTRSAAPEPIPAGTPIRIEAGKYAGWTGVIRWTHVKGSARTYTVVITGSEGQRKRSQVAHASQGSSWVVTGEPVAVRPLRRRAPAPTVRATRAPAAARAVTSDLLVKGATITMLSGKYAGYLGDIVAVAPKPGPVPNAIYSAVLTGPAGQRARTQIAHRSEGKSWAPAGGGLRGTDAAAGEPSKVIRRRGEESTAAAAMPATAVPQGAVPVPPPSAGTASSILAAGTPVRMLAGQYLGFTGRVSSVRALPGPRPDAVYTLLLSGPRGQKGRTSVKQGSLGRTWQKL
ncbi:MAG: hypothetical protein FJ087_19290 [Deltaproteobacteria bacterium]|nr:hypothetical protein [Deltaproteobacteria bacterium]